MELSPLAAVHALHRKILAVADASHAALQRVALRLSHWHSATTRENCYSPKYLSAIAMPSS
jgi:hypothetical protein